MNIKIKKTLISLLVIMSSASSLFAANQTLTLSSFIQQAISSDLMFETILIDQLALKYRRDILLPSSDVIMDIKYRHNFYLDQNRNNPEAGISLSKIFPYNGTQLSLSYNRGSSIISSNEDSSLQFLISQPLAQNAFGTGVQLSDKIIGIENEISRYQVIEAYEDYLASLTSAYYNWYSAYENIKVGKASYKSNQKLMDNILERQQQKIALPIDVNKMELLLIAKKENLIVLQEVYDNVSNLIYKALRLKGETTYIPVKPKHPVTQVKFEEDYQEFTKNSRTYQILNLLEQQGTFEVNKAADDLLPSTNLLLGYKKEGKDWEIRNKDESYYAGIEIHWPFGQSVDKAKQKTAQIKHKKTLLSNQNKYEELRTNLQNIYQQIQREQKLIKVADKKIILAEAVLKDEAENYSYGKVTLNDYIDAVNLVDQTHFSFTEHTVQLNKLFIEWLRLTDKLVDKHRASNLKRN